MVLFDPETPVHHTEWSGAQADGVVRIVPAPGASTWRLQVTGDGETTETRIDDSRRRPVPTW